MPTIINVEHLSKQYRIDAPMRHNSFRDIFDEKVKSILNFAKRKEAKKESTIWALQDVSFDVEEGEVLGIIGRNGAGKSTLLKILSRITEPTKGSVRMRGRVASLLEVGTGFSGELSGRENIFLNGAILGMKKAEIDRKFDEIVAFAEVEQFIDTPVKRYSSGMYMRLAFAVAAHLEPEILVVDEVLAVGDAQFQKKCLGKMKSISNEGRTVLFVSHNLGAVRMLCSHALLLSSGAVVNYSKNIDEVLKGYEKHTAENSFVKPVSTLQTDKFALTYAVTKTSHQVQSTTFNNDENIIIELSFSHTLQKQTVQVGFILYNDYSQKILLATNLDSPNHDATIPPGNQILQFTIPGNLLNGGNYRVDVFAARPNVESLALYEGIVHFEVQFTVPRSEYWTTQRAGDGVIIPAIGTKLL